MVDHTPRKPHRNPEEEAEGDEEPGMLPVEPDEGTFPQGIPLDPDQDDVIEPEPYRPCGAGR